MGRNSIEARYKWDLSDIFENEAAWEACFSQAEKDIAAVAAFEGKLGEKAAVSDFMRLYERISGALEDLYAYAHMLRDEDNRVSLGQALTARAQTLLTRFETETAFLAPELLALPEAYLEELLSDEGLAFCRVFLRNIVRQKEHTLSAAEEKIVAMAGEMAAAPDTVYTMLADADMRFPVITGEDGEPVRVTHGNYISMMMSRDRRVRREAFDALYETYKSFSSTIPALYDASVKADVFHARTARHPSCLEAALFPDEVPPAVYENLILAVRDHLPGLTRFLKQNMKLIGADKPSMIDVYVPAVSGFSLDLPFDEAYDVVVDALGVLGEDYQAVLRRARDERWIDAFENEGKSSGAYSWGTYRTHPYVLLNYKENLDALTTIAHEMGHSLHSYMSNRAQPPLAAGYSLFVAEVASTTNEILVLKKLMERYPDDKHARAFLLYQLLDGFRGTVFRQTMFAEFEKNAHRMAENGEALTAESLNEMYARLNADYYPELYQEPLIAYEWMRIPHFYNAFYVYKYATGFSAAMALATAILEEGAPAVERYKTFLSLGGSLPPIEALRVAGVDMEKKESVEQALTAFERMVEEYVALTE